MNVVISLWRYDDFDSSKKPNATMEYGTFDNECDLNARLGEINADKHSTLIGFSELDDQVCVVRHADGSTSTGLFVRIIQPESITDGDIIQVRVKNKHGTMLRAGELVELQ